MLARLTRVLDRLTVYPENMQRNMDMSGNLFFSQQVLLALIQKGITREDAYRIVQRNAMEVWNTGGNLREQLKLDSDVTARLDDPEIDAIFDLHYHLKNVDVIFERVFGR